jgi:ATP-dependent RNA circularization protein (DNA/RNA ligase family)
MKRSVKEYLQKLSDKELDSLELEVLHASRDKSKNYFLKEIASEREYRSIKKVYDDIKNGTFSGPRGLFMISGYPKKHRISKGTRKHYLKTIEETKKLGL